MTTSMCAEGSRYANIQQGSSDELDSMSRFRCPAVILGHLVERRLRVLHDGCIIGCIDAWKLPGGDAVTLPSCRHPYAAFQTARGA